MLAWRMFTWLCVLFFLVSSLRCQAQDVTVPDSIVSQIRSMKDDVQAIFEYYESGPGKNQVYDRLALFTDTIGHRLAGSAAMKRAVAYMDDALKADGLDNVHGEAANVPNWVRGNESVTLLEPRVQNMGMLGLGLSVGTPKEGITAEVLVVESFDELSNRSAEAAGKIVLFNQKWEGYGVSVAYRVHGADHVAKVGGLAALVRTVAPFSIYSPHTGGMQYGDGVKKVPTACVTIEDAEMLARMQARGTKIVVKLYMEATDNGLVESMNTVAEVQGTVHPEQVVLVSGHLDSWDVGQGAMDDGGGAFISWQALSTVRHLGLKPKRTMRAVLWTGEEYDGYGGRQYYTDHKNDAKNMDIVMESDSGVFKPRGLGFSGTPQAKAIVTEIMKYLKPYNASLVSEGGGGTDIEFWFPSVPGGSLDNENEDYFFYHHSNGDTMTVLDPDEMDQCAALWTIISYCIANLDEMLPR